MKFFLIPFAALAFTGCVTTGGMAKDASNVRLGQTVIVDGPKIRVTRILEDSRCPMNARCIWAGRVKIQALWIRPSGNQPFEVVLGEPTQLADGKITLTSARPDRRTDKKIKPSDYRFSFEFQGGL